MLSLHTAQREDACKFQLSDNVTIFFAQVLPLELQAHRSHVLYRLPNELLDLVHILLREDSHEWSSLDQASEHGQTSSEVTLSSQVDTFDHLVFEGLD